MKTTTSSTLPRLLGLGAIVSVLLASATADAQSGGWRKSYPKLRYGVQSVETQAAALTRYMRDYIWSIGGTDMITARPDPGLPAPQEIPRTPPATPVQTGALETRPLTVSR